MGKTILKRLLTVTTGLIIAAGLVLCGGLSMKVQARDLTLVTDTGKVSYGTLTADDIVLLKKIFDKDYYLAEYPELAEKVGTSYDALFDHFCKYGIFEGRTCCAAFDPSAYLAAYADARDYAGKDIMKAYRHYIETGMGEGRTLTNIQGAIGSGITVTSIIDPSIVITPEVWAWSVKLGTKDYQAIIKAIAAAKAAAATVEKGSSGESGETVIVAVEEEELEKVIPDSKGYTHVDTIKVGDSSLYILFVQNYCMGTYEDKYAAYRFVPEDDDNPDRYVLVEKTDGFEGEDVYEGEKGGCEEVVYPESMIDDGVRAVAAATVETKKCEIHTDIAVEEYNDVEAVDPPEELDIVEYDFGLCVHADDYRATDSTTYDIGVKFDEHTDESVSFSIDYEGSDGYSLEEEFSVELNNEPR